jgi:hypothetical protein
VQSSIRTEGNTLKFSDVIRKIVFGTVLPSLGLLWSADDYLSNSDCAALRAMTGLEWESAFRLFGSFPQLLKFCGAIRDFDFSILRSHFFGLHSPLSLLRSPFFDLFKIFKLF